MNVASGGMLQLVVVVGCKRRLRFCGAGDAFQRRGEGDHGAMLSTNALRSGIASRLAVAWPEQTYILYQECWKQQQNSDARTVDPVGQAREEACLDQGGRSPQLLVAQMLT